MLTIGELAAYAGVTVRAVRHYHAKGLLPEPERDHRGYRRYNGGAVVELIKIRTLAESGVPLARVHNLLQADEEEFGTALATIDEQLQAQIQEWQRRRERIARLPAGDNLALPPEIVEFLDRLGALGIDQRIIRFERDGWIPLAVHAPERVPEWIARKNEQLADPQLVDFYRTLGRALDRTADDPRLAELADRMSMYLTRIADEHGENYLATTDIEPSLVGLLDTLAFDTVPQARRLIELLQKRGWAGWTKLERFDPKPGDAEVRQEDAESHEGDDIENPAGDRGGQQIECCNACPPQMPGAMRVGAGRPSESADRADDHCRP